MDPTWQHPFSAIVSGPSGCGKTQFTFKFIQHMDKMVNTKVDEILWCYGIYQDIFDEYPLVQFHEGLPDLNRETDERVTMILTKISHHCNVSVLYLTQNIFYKGKYTRNHKS